MVFLILLISFSFLWSRLNRIHVNYGKLHHLGFLRCEVIDELRFLNHPNTVTQQNIIEQAEEIWENEVEPKEDLLANAIKECKEIDEKANRRAIL